MLELRNGRQGCRTRKYMDYSYNTRFNRGETLTFDQWRLGDCSNYDFDQNTKISLVTSVDDAFCPTLVEVHLTDYHQNFDENYDNVYFAKVNKNGRKWFNRGSTNRLQFPVQTLAQATGGGIVDIQCPNTGCPVTDLIGYEQAESHPRQCVFA